VCHVTARTGRHWSRKAIQLQFQVSRSSPNTSAVTSIPPGGYEVLQSAYLHVSLSLRSHVSKTTRPNFMNFSMRISLPVAVTKFSSDDSAIGYVLSVLWMTSGFLHNGTQILTWAIGELFTRFARWRLSIAHPVAKCTVIDCVVL